MKVKDGNTILVGVDGSERSADALALAVTLAGPLQATLLTAYVHPYGDLRNVLCNTQFEEAVGALADSVNSHMQRLAMPVDERAMTVLGDRSPARGLQRIAEQRGANVVVVGPSHRSRMGRVFPGGTAERLLSGAPCAVAIAPRGYAERKHALADVGLAFDGSPESQVALSWARLLARQSGAHVRVITVQERLPGASVALADGLPVSSLNAYLHRDLAEKLTEAERELSEEDISVEATLLEGEAVALLEKQAAGLDLLVMGSRGYGPARAVLLGSVSQALVRGAASPVMVVPRNAEETLVPAAA